MSRKDYELIARAIQEVYKGYPDAPKHRKDFVRKALFTVAGEIASALQADNPRFDRERFLRACGF